MTKEENPDPNIINLSSEEGLGVANAALLQQLRAIRQNWAKYDHGHYVPERGIVRRVGETINGSWGEFALCKRMNVAWKASVNGKRGADLMDRLLIRTTELAWGHCNITKQEARDFPDFPYAFLTGAWPEFRFVGWCWIKEGTLPEYYKPRGTHWNNMTTQMDGWWIDQGAPMLRDLGSLYDLIESWRKRP